MTGPTQKFRLEDVSSAELQDLLPHRPVILLPLGSQEDQGAHAPMGDFRLAGLLAERIARTATQAGCPTLAAPALPFGAADHFGGIAGGMALTPATFRAVLGDLLADLRGNGLDRVIILNGHGGNAAIIHEVTQAIRRISGAIIPSVTLWKIARRLMERRIGADPQRFGHAGEPLASIALHLRPDAVRMARAVAPVASGALLGCPVAGFGAIGFAGIEIDAPVRYGEVAPNAATADATAADAVLGAAVADELVAIVARFCAHYAAQA